MDKLLSGLEIVGGASSALLALITLIGIIASKTAQGKTWVSKALGILDLKDKLEQHLNSDSENIQLQKVQSRAILSMLRNTLRHMCTEALKKGSITANELETILKAHASYHEMNGNSFIDEMVEKVKELPVKNELY